MKRLSPADLNRSMQQRDDVGKRKKRPKKQRGYDRRDMRAKP